MGGMGGLFGNRAIISNAALDRPSSPTSSQSVLSSFARDTSPAAERIAELLKITDPKEFESEARRLWGDLPTLIPDDPAMAAVLADEMAKAMADAVENGNATLANMREYKRDNNGQFSETDNPSDYKPGKNPDSSATQAAEIGKGKAAISRCLLEKRDIPDAVSRGDIGTIGLVYGDERIGLAHFVERKDALSHLAETLIRGEAGKPYQDGQKINLKYGKYTAVLSLSKDPKNPDRPDRWIMTAFKPDDQKHERT